MSPEGLGLSHGTQYGEPRRAVVPWLRCSAWASASSTRMRASFEFDLPLRKQTLLRQLVGDLLGLGGEVALRDLGRWLAAGSVGQRLGDANSKLKPISLSRG
jgi:hypothetical protein